MVLKETIGSYNIPECDYSIFPRDEKNEAICVSRPVFLVRDPIEVMDAKIRRGWKSTLENSVRAYGNVFAEYQYSRTIARSNVLCCTYQHLMADPENVIRRICSHWGIMYEDVMLKWRYPFPSAIRGGQDFCELVESGAFDGIANNETVAPKEYKGLLLDVASILRMTRGDLSMVYEYYETMKADADVDFG